MYDSKRILYAFSQNACSAYDINFFLALATVPVLVLVLVLAAVVLAYSCLGRLAVGTVLSYYARFFLIAHSYGSFAINYGHQNAHLASTALAA